MRAYIIMTLAINILLNIINIKDIYLPYLILIFITFLINKIKFCSLKIDFNFKIKSIIISIFIAVIIFILRIITLRVTNSYTLSLPINWIECYTFMIIAVISEELYYRYLCFKLVESKYIVTISGLIFLLSHLNKSLVHLKFDEILFFIGAITSWFLMGILLSYSYKLTKSLITPIIIHLGINFISPLISQTQDIRINSVYLFLYNNLYLIIILIIMFLLKNILKEKDKYSS